MGARRMIRGIYERNAATRLLLRLPAALYRDVYRRYLQSDYDFIRAAYHHTFGSFPDLEAPITLNEKIQWRKVYDRNPAFVSCADKYRVRSYVKSKVGDEHLIRLLLVTDEPRTIDISSLPSRFVVKANHGCGWNELVWDKQRLDRESLVRRIETWLRTNFYYQRREWQYRDIEACVLVEEMVLDEHDRLPTECRVFCFDGTPEFLEIVTGRFTDDLTVDYYDLDWNHLPVLHDTYASRGPQCRPANFRDVLRIAERLSADFDFVRVDLYLARSRIYFGELTFTPNAGFLKFHPAEYDEIFGRAWRLPDGVTRRGRHRRSDTAGRVPTRPTPRP